MAWIEVEINAFVWYLQIAQCRCNEHEQFSLQTGEVCVCVPFYKSSADVKCFVTEAYVGVCFSTDKAEPIAMCDNVEFLLELIHRINAQTDCNLLLVPWKTALFISDKEIF